MPRASLPPEKQAEIEDLELAIPEADDAEIGELAEDLAITDDTRLLGANEFKIRAIPEQEWTVSHGLTAAAFGRTLLDDRQGPAVGLPRAGPWPDASAAEADEWGAGRARLHGKATGNEEGDYITPTSKPWLTMTSA